MIRRFVLAAVLAAFWGTAAYGQAGAPSMQGIGIPGTQRGGVLTVQGDPSGTPIPVTATVTPSGTQDVNVTKVNGNTALAGAGATGTGSLRTTTAQDATTIAGSAPGTAGTPSANVISVQGIPSGTTIPVTSSPGARTIVPLDVSTVTTGGTAVTALTAGHRTAGGFLYNPIGATINLCINEQATASGTTSAAGLTCIQPGQSYTLVPAAGAVSVITSDSSHPFSGEGLN